MSAEDESLFLSLRGALNSRSGSEAEGFSWRHQISVRSPNGSSVHAEKASQPPERRSSAAMALRWASISRNRASMTEASMKSTPELFPPRAKR